MPDNLPEAHYRVDDLGIGGHGGVLPDDEWWIIITTTRLLKGKPMAKKKSFADYKAEGANWITLATGEYYPDILPAACDLYEPIIALFGELLKTSESSERLFRQIIEQSDGWTRVQLSRVFRKYVSPSTPVEMLKRKSKVDDLIREFGKEFRSVMKSKKLTVPVLKETKRFVHCFGNTKIEAKKGMI